MPGIGPSQDHLIRRSFVLEKALNSSEEFVGDKKESSLEIIVPT